ncbi:hypothetical protein BH11PSE10_BH11PSE10_04510 [soil metagenome]
MTPIDAKTPFQALLPMGSALLLSLMTAACGGGGGGSTPAPTPPPKGPLTVTTAPVLAGGNLVFTISLGAGAVGPADIAYSTSNPTTNTGDATPGDRCNSVGVDYVQISNGTASVPGGASSTTVTIATCPNPSFEPNEALALTTTFESRTTSTKATIVNATAGGLNDTGITQCLNAAGALLACAATDIAGQDGAFGRDASALSNEGSDGRVGFAFAASGGSCLEDKVTGLVWDNSTASTATLAAAQALPAIANAAARCGRSDWRLPTADELDSLVDNGAAGGARIDARFTATAALPTWSSTAYAADTRANWVVDFASGALAFESATNPLAKAFATRLIAGTAGTSYGCDEAATDRYTDHGNSTVTDKRTGLQWQLCVDGLSGAACGTGTATTHASFAAAHARAAAVNADTAGLSGVNKGFSDWRVPNKNELASLVNYRCSAPAIQRSRFPATPPTSTWTSSPLAAGLVWYVDFADGNVGPSGANGSRVLRLVRAGQ